MLKFLVPPFIKNLDKNLVLNYPFWYIVKLHYLLYFTVLMWAISYFVGCILPIDLSSYNPQNVTGTWIFLFSVLGIVLFCVWMYYLTIYNSEDHFGKFSIWDDVKLLAVLLVGLNLLMSFSYPMQLRVKSRLANTFTDAELAQQYNSLNLGYKYITSNIDNFQYCGHDVHEVVDYRELAKDTDEYGQARYIYDLNKYKSFTYFSPHNTQRFNYSFSSLFFSTPNCKESTEFKHALFNDTQIENGYVLQKSKSDQLNAITAFFKVNAVYENRYYNNLYAPQDYLDNYHHYEKKCVTFFPEAHNVKPENKTIEGPNYLPTSDVSQLIGNVYEAKFALHFILSDGYLLFAFYFSFFLALMIILFRNNRWQHFLVSVVSFILIGIILGIVSLASGSHGGHVYTTLSFLAWIAAGVISLSYYFKKDKYRTVGAVATMLFYFCLPLMPFFLCVYAHEVFDWLKCFNPYSDTAAQIAACEIADRTYKDALVLAQLIGVSAFIVLAMPFYKAFFARQKALPREK